MIYNCLSQMVFSFKLLLYLCGQKRGKRKAERGREPFLGKRTRIFLRFFQDFVLCIMVII